MSKEEKIEKNSPTFTSHSPLGFYRNPSPLHLFLLKLQRWKHGRGQEKMCFSSSFRKIWLKLRGRGGETLPSNPYRVLFPLLSSHWYGSHSTHRRKRGVHSITHRTEVMPLPPPFNSLLQGGQSSQDPASNPTPSSDPKSNHSCQ